MADTGGVNIVLTPETATAVAQRLVCWDKVGGVPAQSVQYRTDGNRPYFRIPAGSCAGKPPLTLTPGGTTIACPASGSPTYVVPTAADVHGLNPAACTEMAAPTGLVVNGTPTQTSIGVKWTAPATGPAPTGYRLTYRKDATTGAWSVVEVGAGTLQATVTGLTANTAYDFRVQARHNTYLSPPTADTTLTTAT